MTKLAKKIVISVSITVILLILLCCGYSLKLHSTEGRIISSTDWLEKNMLIPSLLRAPVFAELGRINHYYYSADDGVKPQVSAVNIELLIDETIARTKIEQWLHTQGFRLNDQHAWRRQQQEIEVIFTQIEADQLPSVNIALLDYIN